MSFIIQNNTDGSVDFLNSGNTALTINANNSISTTSPVFSGIVSGITAEMVGLGNVTNESKTTMFTNPTFSGTVILPSTTTIGNISSTEIGYLDLPLPYWENIIPTTGIGASNSFSFVDEGNRRMYINNGNNGATAKAKMVGILKGEFEIHYECSYLWGWSGIYLISKNYWDSTSNTTTTTGKVLGTFNNNSNNQCGYSNYSGWYAVTGGFSTGVFKVWRNSSNNIYFRPPNGVDYLMANISDDFYVTNQNQSPSWIRLIAVINKH